MPPGGALTQIEAAAVLGVTLIGEIDRCHATGTEFALDGAAVGEGASSHKPNSPTGQESTTGTADVPSTTTARCRVCYHMGTWDPAPWPLRHTFRS